jgi:hypothetical protein
MRAIAKSRRRSATSSQLLARTSACPEPANPTREASSPQLMAAKQHQASDATRVFVSIPMQTSHCTMRAKAITTGVKSVNSLKLAINRLGLRGFARASVCQRAGGHALT